MPSQSPIRNRKPPSHPEMTSVPPSDGRGDSFKFLRLPPSEKGEFKRLRNDEIDMLVHENYLECIPRELLVQWLFSLGGLPLQGFQSPHRRQKAGA